MNNSPSPQQDPPALQQGHHPMAGDPVWARESRRLLRGIRLRYLVNTLRLIWRDYKRLIMFYAVLFLFMFLLIALLPPMNEEVQDEEPVVDEEEDDSSLPSLETVGDIIRLLSINLCGSLILLAFLLLVCFGPAAPDPFLQGLNRESDHAFLHLSLLNLSSLTVRITGLQALIFLALGLSFELLALGFLAVSDAPIPIGPLLAFNIILLTHVSTLSLLGTEASLYQRVHPRLARLPYHPRKLLPPFAMVFFFLYLSVPLWRGSLALLSLLIPLLLVPVLLHWKKDVYPFLHLGWYDHGEAKRNLSYAREEGSAQVQELPRVKHWSERWIFDPGYHGLREKTLGNQATRDTGRVMSLRAMFHLETSGVLVLAPFIPLALVLLSWDTGDRVIRFIGLSLFGMFSVVLVLYLLIGVKGLAPQPYMFFGGSASTYYLLPVPGSDIVDQRLREQFRFFILCFMLLGPPPLLYFSSYLVRDIMVACCVLVLILSFASFSTYWSYASLKNYDPNTIDLFKPRGTILEAIESWFFWGFYSVHLILLSFFAVFLTYRDLQPLQYFLITADTVLLIPFFRNRAIKAYDNISIH